MPRKLPDPIERREQESDAEFAARRAMSKRRLVLFRRVYQAYYQWGALIESGETSDIITVEGEDVYYYDLLAGLDSLPPRQRQAFDLICLQSYTESAATAIMMPHSKWSTPCLVGETPVVTYDGVRPIGELAGTAQRVIGRDGQWKSAEVRSFGNQPLFSLKVDADSHSREFLVTGSHRWILQGLGEAETVDLEPGQTLRSLSATRWEVVSVDDLGDEGEVYCAVVPDGQAFCLGEGLLTGNCQQYAEQALARMVAAYDLVQAGRSDLVRAKIAANQEAIAKREAKKVGSHG